MKTLLLKLIVVGKMKDRALADKCSEYLKRLNSYAKVEMVELKDSTPEDEAVRIRKNFDASRELVLAMGEEGRESSSAGFAAMLGAADRRITLIIGGPYGLSPEIKREATMLFSLSKMTFTHEFARLILLEQLYRAGTILNGSGYHH
ncbi:MAG: 23S rRNA (pseudouridine(1915)-N(3))-methyltransferase RlmH [Victivallaceae bacterium]|nr:23S rRNA (pseudouridine(1915)-N(3))-methyltransferase RlmH [Victivallaceae bacterium]